MSVVLVKGDDPSLLAEQDGEPRLHRVLGAYLHLEPLEADDEDRLDRASARLAAALGPELRWTHASVLPGVQRYRPTDLDFISGSVSALPQPQTGRTLEEQFLAADLGQLARNDLEVHIQGGDNPEAAHPISIRCWAEIVGIIPGDANYTFFPVLAFTVPETWPLDALRQLVLDTAAELRVRWGNLGLTYASWDVYDVETAARARYAHARRHPGFDVGEYVRCVHWFHEKIRTVSWITILGPTMIAELRPEQRVALDRRPLLYTGSVGPNLVIQAGAAPEAGDRNRLNFPPAYAEVDRVLRPQRASRGADMLWLNPWKEATIEEWLRRFEGASTLSGRPGGGRWPSPT
ncbi:type VI immunity family protein [Sorangium cellulosum]|uniref:DUF3396 domain-containing protein n=1 Tax=Sorangium cellulosum So0157-2 TaxID=1254432 RepID=S4XVC7_SORCE|nr:type VI immunity family protein [Sorangium cellulosum]AGP36439.1 hypothetical protein SCE1572_19255 [Sorangium cellulosum So0157-2]